MRNYHTNSITILLFAFVITLFLMIVGAVIKSAIFILASIMSFSVLSVILIIYVHIRTEKKLKKLKNI